MALPDDVFLVEDASNDEADWDDDRPKAEPPPGVSAEPILLSQLGLTLAIEDHIMTWDDAVVSMTHDFEEATPMLFVEQLPISFFPIPKRDGRIRWISDFKARDRAQHHQVYPMPLLSELTTESHTYKPLPMGLSASPQDFMKTIFTYPFVLVTTDALLSSPDHHLPFDIEAVASACQIDAVIKQNGRPVAYYSCKLNPAQRVYALIEKVLLSLIQTMTKFRPLLCGALLHIYTAHTNFTDKLSAFPTQRMRRWRLLLDEFDCIFFYNPGLH